MRSDKSSTGTDASSASRLSREHSEWTHLCTSASTAVPARENSSALSWRRRSISADPSQTLSSAANEISILSALKIALHKFFVTYLQEEEYFVIGLHFKTCPVRLYWNFMQQYVYLFFGLMYNYLTYSTYNFYKLLLLKNNISRFHDLFVRWSSDMDCESTTVSAWAKNVRRNIILIC